MAEVAVTNFAIDAGALAVATEASAWGANSDLGLYLVSIPFTPDPNLQDGDLSYLGLDGLAHKVGAASTPTMAWNSEMGVWGINVPFTGGNVFTYTGSGDPDTIAYGWAIKNNDTDALVVTGTFDEPIVFDHMGVQAHVPEVNAWFAAPFIGNLPTPSV